MVSGGQVQGAALRGFLVHDAAVSLANLAANDGTANGTSATQQGSRPGVAAPTDPLTSYTVRAHNGQDADVRVRVVRPGNPGTDGAGVLYREELEVQEDYRGWNEPNLMTGFYPIDWTTTEEWRAKAALTVPASQKVVVLAADVLAGVAPSSWTWDPVTRTFGSRVAVSSSTDDDRICGVLLRDTGRLLAIYTDISGGRLNVAYSDDAATSWTQYSRDINAGGAGLINTAIDEISAAEDRNGAILLVGTDTSTGDLYRYRSVDRGATFEEVETVSAFGTRAQVVTLATGQLLLVYREQTTLDPMVVVLADAFEDVSGKTGTSLNGTNDAEYVAPVVDADGVVYVYMPRSISGGSADQVKVARSTDNGTTWSLYSHDALSHQDGPGTRTNYMHHVQAAAYSGGEILALGKTLNADSSPTSDGSLVAWTFGGWSNLEARGGQTRIARRGFGGSGGNEAATFVPSDTLDNQGWTLTGTSHSVLSGQWRFLTAGANCHVTHSSSNALGTDGLTQAGEFHVASASTETAIMYSRRAGKRVEILATTSQFRAWDSGAGTQFGSTVTIDLGLASDPVQIAIVWADEDTVTVFYKRRSESVWTKGPQKNPVSGGLALVPEQQYDLGAISGSPSADVRISWFAYVNRSMLHDTSDDLPFLQDLAWGKALTSAPYPVRDQGGTEVLHLSAVGGASRHAEGFAIPAEHDHGFREVIPQQSPSPDRRWRSTDTAEQIVAWDLVGEGYDTRLGTSWAPSFALIGANFRTAHIEGRTHAGSWVTIGTYDGAVATGLSYALTGVHLEPGTSGASASRFWRAGELAGGHVILDPNGTPKVRRIVDNSAGGWGPGSAFAPVLELAGLDSTEAATGEVHVIAPAGVLVVHTASKTRLRRLRLRIPTQDTAEGYFELGQLVAGALLVPGQQWSRGFSWRMAPNTTTETDDTGTMWTDNRGPEVRELTVSWQDGLDLTHPRHMLVPPWIGARFPLAAERDVWWQLEHLQRVTQGYSLPVVALADIPTMTTTIHDPSLWLYGLVEGRVQANHVQGREGRSELVRVESLTVREQPWRRYAAA